MNDAVATLKAKSKSFYWAGCLLPRHRLEDVATLYAYCRQMDDAIDERDAPHEVENALSELQAGTGDLARLCAAYAIPHSVPTAFLHALLADRAPVRCADRRDMLRFCYGVAGTVGLMMSHVLGCRRPASLYRAIDMGIAMQLVNIARDRHEDIAAGRDYLPPGDSQSDLVALAQHYYASGMAGIDDLPRAVRPAIMTAAYVYRDIGRAIRQQPERAARERMVISRPRKAWLTVMALASCLRGSSAGAHDAALHKGLEGLPLTHTGP